jgi:hypothetical protein
MTHSNGAVATAPLDDFAKRQRVRQLVRCIADRTSVFRGVLRAHRADLAELVELTNTDAADLLAMLDALPRNVDDLVYYASSGEHDAHEGENV